MLVGMIATWLAGLGNAKRLYRDHARLEAEVDVLPDKERAILAPLLTQSWELRGENPNRAASQIAALREGATALVAARDVQDGLENALVGKRWPAWMHRVRRAAAALTDAVSTYETSYDSVLVTLRNEAAACKQAIDARAHTDNLQRRAKVAQHDAKLITQYSAFAQSAKLLVDSIDGVDPDPSSPGPDVPVLTHNVDTDFTALEAEHRRVHGQPLPTAPAPIVPSGLAADGAPPSPVAPPAARPTSNWVFDLKVWIGRTAGPIVPLIVAVVLLAIGMKVSYLDNANVRSDRDRLDCAWRLGDRCLRRSAGANRYGRSRLGSEGLGGAPELTEGGVVANLRYGLDPLDELRELVTGILLVAPADPDGEGAAWRDLSREILAPYVGPAPANQPVITGVGTGYLDGEPTMVLFSTDVGIDTEPIASMLNTPVRMKNWITGPVLPAARPTQGGDSLSGACVGGDTGTLGCRVEDRAGNKYVLGCNHTLAGVNRAVLGVDTVWQPGAGDGGTGADILGTLQDFEKIHLGGTQRNTMDAAIALIDANDVDPGLRVIGPITGYRALSYNERVRKVGWITGETHGENILTSAYQTLLPDPTGALVPTLFVDQHTIRSDPGTRFADRGDSGSAVVTEDGADLVGIVIGVLPGPDLAFVSPVMPIVSRFGVVPA